MKNTIKIFAALAASLLAFSCTPDFPSPDKGGVPSIDKITPVITVDQETNYVTFSVQESGIVPMWIFGEETIDKNVNKKYAYTGNGITLRIRAAGTHVVELKVFNSNGVSLGSKTCEYTLENTYRDPFDPSKTLKALANTWAWNADATGHFGCGEPGTDGLNWWSAGPHDKDGFSLYDDLMTFTVDGQYTYDPVDGQTYVNKDSGFRADLNPNDGNDYVVPIEGFTHPFTVEQTFNDAGIEELWVVLQEGDNLSYIPNPDALSNPRYKILAIKAGKQLDLVVDNGRPADQGGISWHYQFVPFVKQATPAELLAGTDEKGKAWVIDFDAPGHLGCGANADDPTGWWSAAPGDKSDTGLFDDELTFFADGTYSYNSGADGLVYVNTGVTAVGADYWKSEDFDMPWESFTSTYEFDGELITLPEGKILGYLPNDAALAEPKYVVKEISENKLVLVNISDPGIAWQYIFKPAGYVAPSQTINGVAVAGGKVDLSLAKGDAITVDGIELGYIDPDFFEGEAGSLKFAAEDGDYRIYVLDGGFLKVVPLVAGEPATWDSGKALWIIGTGLYKTPESGEPGWNTDPVKDLPFAKNGNKYQLTVYVTGPNFKVFGQPNWGMEVGGDMYSAVEANDYFSINGFPGGAASDNGNIWSGDAFAEGWYIITLTDNGDDTYAFAADKKKETFYDIEGATNLYRSATITPEIWYTGGDWSGGLFPEYEIGANNDFTATMPDGIGGEEWKGQNKLHTGVATSNEKVYDFCCTLVCDEDCVVTIKLTGNPEGEGDPHAFFYDGNVKLTADEPLTYKKAGISQRESNGDFTVIFDYGRVPAGATVSATQICFQEHMER